MALNLDALNSIMGRPNGGAQNLGGVPVRMEDLVALKSATSPGQGQALGNMFGQEAPPANRVTPSKRGAEGLPQFTARPDVATKDRSDAYADIFKALQSGELVAPNPLTPIAAAAPQDNAAVPAQPQQTQGNPYAAFRTSVADTLKRISGISIDDEYFKGLFPQGGPQEFVNRFTEVFGPALSRNFSGLNTIRTAGKTFGNRQSTT